MRCPGCQQENPEGARFCNSCGTRLTAAAPAAAPRTYTPAHLAEKILTSRSAMVGERKQVTVLFADLKGSMELLADRDPEEARRLLDAYLDGVTLDAFRRRAERVITEDASGLSRDEAVVLGMLQQRLAHAADTPRAA